MSWDPTTYLGFAGHRTRPAAELLARIDMTSPARVADLVGRERLPFSDPDEARRALARTSA